MYSPLLNRPPCNLRWLSFCGVLLLAVWEVRGQEVVPGSDFGYTSGSFAVSDAGAATYTIPLFAPPGTAGLQPQLSLQYSSLGGNGPLGLGWSLQGLSAITRTGRTRAQDETVTATNQTKAVALNVSYTQDDRYALDGSRLVLAPESILPNRRFDGNYGKDQTVYYTEQQSFTKVILYANPTTGAPQSFKAYAKSGLIYEYGTADNARVIDPTKQVGVQWLVNRIEDRRGNYMTFRYLQDATTGEAYPESIEYTGNVAGGLAPYNKITFVYETRPDVTALYGQRFQQKTTLTRRLKAIQVHAQNTLIRQYNLAYVANRYSQLSSLTECDGTGQCFKPTTFQWQQETGSPGQAVTLASNATNIIGDFNGDGLQDYVIFNRIPTPTAVNQWSVTTIYQFYINNGQGGFSFAGEVRPPTPQILSDASLSDFLNRRPFVAELNGDNVDDVVLNWSKLQYIPGVPVPVNTGFEFILSKAIPGNPYACSFIYSVSAIYGSTLPLFADVSGDAISDQTVLTYTSSGQPVIGTSQIVSDIPGDKYAVYYQMGEYSSIPGYNAGLSYANPHHHLVDLNGDGLSELFIYDKNSGQNLTVFTGSVLVDSSLVERQNNYRVGYRSYLRNTVTPGLMGAASGTALFFDANADKLPDLIYYLPSENLLRIVPNRGDGTFDSALDHKPLLGTTPVVTTYPNLLQLDHDADGLMDLIFYEKTNGNNVLFLNQGDFTFAPATQASNVYPPTMFKTGNWYKIGPFLKGSVADVLYFDAAQNKTFILPLGQKNTILITKITDGSHLTTTIQYDNLLNRDFHQRTGNIQYPVIDFQAALSVAAKARVNSPDGYKTTRTYRYEGATLNIEGRGFRGFSKIIETDTTTGIYTIKTFRQGIDSWRYGGHSLLKTERFYADGSPISVTENTATLIPYPTTTPGNQLNRAKCFLAYYSIQKTIDFVTGKTRFVRQQLDPYGNPIYQVTDYANGFRDSIQTTYQNDTNRWLLGLPTHTTQFHLGTGQTTISRQSSAEYDAVTGLVTQQTAFPNLNDQQKQVTTYTYDAFGNRIQQDLTAWHGTQAETRTNKATYDATGRFTLTETNPLNQVFRATYDPKWGHLLTATDPNNLVTTYQYDGFGRLTKQTAPDGTWIATAYRQASVSLFKSPPNAVSLTYQQTSAGQIFLEQVDAYGRSVQTRAKSFDGRFSVVDRTYRQGDASTQTQETYPYFEGETDGGYTLRENDLLGRTAKLQETKAGGLRTASITYAGPLVMTTNFKGQTSVAVSDAKDQLLEARRNDGHNVFYGYNPAGEPVASRDLMNNTIVHDYDARGFETASSDPDMGLYQYTYNGFGELTGQTYPNGDVVQMEYDKLGRLIKRTEKEGTTTWQYDMGNKAVGKLASVTSYGSQTTYTYDNLGRLNQEKQVIDGQTYTSTYAYDSQGRVQELTYPTGLKVKYVYNAHGFLSELRHGITNALFWQRTATDARGNTTLQQFGNGVVTEKQYDPATRYLTGITSRHNTTILQQFAYQYDELANLTERNNVKRNKTETFTYDALNRLTSSQVTGANSIMLEYDELGNITSKSDVGKYHYGSTGNGPHQLRSIALYAEGIPCSYALNIASEYTSFNKANRVANDTAYLQITYGPDHQRVMQKLFVRNTLTRTKRYVGKLLEVETFADGRSRTTHFLNGLSLWIDDKAANGTTASQTQYLLTDHLGSVTGLTGANGTLLTEYSFDAWGQRRNADWSPLTTQFTGHERGFTQHEHYDLFNLIDMNGRAYDPVLARFLSPDPFVQDRANLQAYNRYSYVMNNPLNATDPSGYTSSPVYIQQVNQGGSFSVYIQQVGLTHAQSQVNFTLNPYQLAAINQQSTNQLPSSFTGQIKSSDGPSLVIAKGLGGSTSNSTTPASYASGSSKSKPKVSFSVVPGFDFTRGNPFERHIIEATDPLPNSSSLDYVSNTSLAFDRTAVSLKNHTGSSTVGNNLKLYPENPETGRSFRGNQHVKTYSLAGFGVKIGRVSGPLGHAVNVTQIGVGVHQDGGNFGKNAQVATGGAAGGLVGAWSGTILGAESGGLAGSFFGPVGTLVGGFIGGVVGGITWGYMGQEVGKDLSK
ncbi:RHS repeat-associated protein [Rhabdobacter roseus]|uniref:RHS repeat-associated protein n=1 Tax=Rhabdobacter roseus TaxID=1655419 RepID=A0A840TTC2_9BACT|nr:RHS repeat-associated protein [Rhabdobacter roseus]